MSLEEFTRELQAIDSRISVEPCPEQEGFYCTLHETKRRILIPNEWLASPDDFAGSLKNIHRCLTDEQFERIILGGHPYVVYNLPVETMGSHE